MCKPCVCVYICVPVPAGDCAENTAIVSAGGQPGFRPGQQLFSFIRAKCLHGDEKRMTLFSHYNPYTQACAHMYSNNNINKTTRRGLQLKHPPEFVLEEICIYNYNLKTFGTPISYANMGSLDTTLC